MSSTSIRPVLYRPLIWTTPLLIIVFSWCDWQPIAVAKSPDKNVLRAGAHAIEVTPIKLPVIVNGGMRERKTSTVTDPLFARCMVLDDGTTRIAIAVVDSCVIPGELIDEVKAMVEQQVGIPAGRILISATHSHSTPSVCSVLGSGQNDDYAEYLGARIVKGIAVADKNLAPARVGWSVGKDPKNVFCRRFIMKPGKAITNPFGGTSNDRAQMNPGYENPNALRRTGVADTDIPVLSVQSAAGEPLAVLANYSTHYAGAPGLSADYFGVFARRIQTLVGGDEARSPFVGIMTNGTSGDANCCDFVNPRREFDYKSVGEDTAQAAFEAYQRIEYSAWTPIAMAQKVLTLKVRRPSEEEVDKANELLAQLGERLPGSIPEVYARETKIMAEWPATCQVKLQAIRIGSLGIVAVPCEVYGSTGLAIKKESPLSTTFTIELANGYNGYLPPPDQFALGGYTTWRARSSYLETGAEPKIRDAVLELLQQVAAD